MKTHELSAKASELSRARAETMELDARMTDVWQRACDAEAVKDKLEHDLHSLKVSFIVSKTTIVDRTRSTALAPMYCVIVRQSTRARAARRSPNNRRRRSSKISRNCTSTTTRRAVRPPTRRPSYSRGTVQRVRVVY